MKIYLISFLISVFMTVLSGTIIFNIIDYIDPPVTEEGFRYMPTENLVKSFFSGIFIGAVVFILALRIQRQKQGK
ncbi:hypothetical protein [Chryseobacterium arthrosphaerae]|uniref:hypothetical protein n=1 Tax=Chryseobacterium arthrosphaerae TaxID=651561 RepID=UPI001E29C680|nr:hypothetical protein [Chryseobacterium arthrosphaerae]UEQ75682.1 hypothetical protein J8N07_18840 [Chryseobacterium arthrosphaerae]